MSIGIYLQPSIIDDEFSPNEKVPKLSEKILKTRGLDIVHNSLPIIDIPDISNPFNKCGNDIGDDRIIRGEGNPDDSYIDLSKCIVDLYLGKDGQYYVHLEVPSIVPIEEIVGELISNYQEKGPDTWMLQDITIGKVGDKVLELNLEITKIVIIPQSEAERTLGHRCK